MTRALLYCTLISVSVASCSKKETATAPSSETIASQIFSAADAAFESAGQAISVAALSKNINTSSFDCDDHGNPGAGVATADRGSAYFYCKITTNDFSPETVKGGYTIVSAILCAIEKQVALSFPSTATETQVTLDLANDNCFEGMHEDASMDLYVTQSRLTGSDWDYRLVLSTGADEAEPFYYVHLKSGDGIFAAKGTDEDETYGWGGFSITIDTNEGIVRYNSWDPRWARQMRLLISGDLSSSGFSNVSGAHMAYADNATSDGGTFTSASWDGTNERYVLENYDLGGTAWVPVAGYPKEEGDVSGLMTIANNGAFYDYAGNWKVGTEEQQKLIDSSSLFLEFTTVTTSTLAF